MRGHGPHPQCPHLWQLCSAAPGNFLQPGGVVPAQRAGSLVNPRGMEASETTTAEVSLHTQAKWDEMQRLLRGRKHHPRARWPGAKDLRDRGHRVRWQESDRLEGTLMLLSFTASVLHMRLPSSRGSLPWTSAGDTTWPQLANQLAGWEPLVSSGRAAGKVLAGPFSCPVCSLVGQ